MNYRYDDRQVDYGGKPYIINIKQNTLQNSNYRTTIWTGCYLQSTLMCIPPCGNIGLEIHPDTDQFIRVEGERAIARHLII